MVRFVQSSDERTEFVYGALCRAVNHSEEMFEIFAASIRDAALRAR